jgi:hypothetical protein
MNVAFGDGIFCGPAPLAAKPLKDKIKLGIGSRTMICLARLIGLDSQIRESTTARFEALI